MRDALPSLGVSARIGVNTGEVVAGTSARLVTDRATDSARTAGRRRRHRTACLRDESLSADGRYLYALGADARKVFAFAVRDDGGLDPVADIDGLPATAAGLAAV